MGGALYFPYISPPASEWFNRVLVYWDSASVIAPHEALAAARTPRTDELRAAGLLSFVPPTYGQRDVESEIWLGSEVQMAQLLEESEALPALQQSFSEGHRMGLFESKMSRELLHRLQHLRLAAPVKDEERRELNRQTPLGGFEAGADYEMGLFAEAGRSKPIEVEYHVAQLIMAALAQRLAEQEGLDPVTDRGAALARACQLVDRMEGALPARTQQARDALLTVSLPSFSNVTPSQIVRFKERTDSLVNGFRQRVEDEALAIAMGDPEARAALQKRAEQRLTHEIQEIEAKMRESRLSLDPVGALISIGTPASVYIGGLAAGSVVAAVSGEILTLLSLWHNLFSTPKAKRVDSELAFAVVARQQR